ncbi:MAG: hypothetical protein AB7G75_18955 [Candidatus Binatia bacterium]
MRHAHAQVPYDYGFLGGDFFPNEDAQISTWNDIHYACHFVDAANLQGAVAQVSRGNRVLVDLSRVWQARTPTCDLNGPWADFGVFRERMQPLVATLNANRERLLALWVFDEPDGGHGGPRDIDLQAAVDYLHAAVPGLPVFINWFDPQRNLRIPNVDWHSTTKGSNPSALSALGKPMLLWWFNNESDPHPKLVNERWRNMIGYVYQTFPPPIAAVGWCCDSISNARNPNNTNSTELRTLVANVGQLRKETGAVTRAPYARRLEGGWYLFRRELDGTLTYTDPIITPDYYPLPIGGVSPFFPAVSREFRADGTWVRLLGVAENRRLYVAWITPRDQWINWTELNAPPATTTPDVIRFQALTWQTIRTASGNVYVQREGVDPQWVNLGGQGTSAPFFKVVDRRLRVASFWPDGSVRSREWAGTGWAPWMIEP